MKVVRSCLIGLLACASVWWLHSWQLGYHAAVHSGHPVSGRAMRQGRRFAMEDRIMIDTSALPSGRFCGAVNYTYAAVYDGHEGSAACNMLQQQLHPLVHAAVAEAWRSSCSIHTPELQANLTAMAERLNKAFLQKARQAQQAAPLCAAANASTAAPASSARGNSNANPLMQQPAAQDSNKDSAGGTGEASAASAAAATAWDGDDGSTAVFAVLAGGQLLIGNVGNSRAIMCTSRTSSSMYSTSTDSPEQRKDLLPHNSSAAGKQRHQRAGAAARTKPAASSTRANSSKDVMPYVAAASRAEQRAAGRHAAASASHALMKHADSGSDADATNDGNITGICNARSDSPQDAPEQTLSAIPLSSEHTPANAQEAARIKAAGGEVSVNPARPTGKSRVRGELEVTRSFGDLGFQDQGVIPTPEFSTHELQPGDAFVVLASDGIFESLSADEVCQHAWAVWSGSNTVPTALPPPPPLALAGQVAAPAAQLLQGPSSGSSVAGRDKVAALIGCCDCTPLQQVQEAAEASEFDVRPLLRRRRVRRNARRGVTVQEQPGEPAAVASAAGLPQEQLVEDRNRHADIVPDATATKIRVRQQEVAPPMNCQTSGATSQLGQCELQGDDDVAGGHYSDDSSGINQEFPDVDFIYDGSTGDPTYGYCKHPTGIESPYTLPQAIALRIVGEAYNRMSMDNLAVAILDVRALAGVQFPAGKGVSSGAKGWSLHAAWNALLSALHAVLGFVKQWIGVPTASTGTISTNQTCLAASQPGTPASVASSESENLVSYVGSSDTIAVSRLAAHSKCSSDGTDVMAERDSLHIVTEADIQALQSLGVSLSLCDIHELVETEQGLFVGPKHMLAHSSSADSVSSNGGTKVVPGHDDSSSETLSQDSTAATDSRTQDSAKEPADAKGVVVCDGIISSSQHASHGAPAAPPVAAAPHSYLLLDVVAKAVSAEANHVHVHPLLGTDEVLAPATHQKGLNQRAEAGHQNTYGSASVARHAQPTGLLLDHAASRALAAPGNKQPQAAPAAHPQAPATGEQLCQSLLQERLQQGQRGETPPGSSHGDTIETTQLSTVGGAQGFMSACLVGTAADPGIQFVRGGAGLSAVVAALAALPLHEFAADAARATTAQGRQLDRRKHVVVGDVSNENLVEPLWGGGGGGASEQLHQHAEHPGFAVSTGVGPWFRAGLLFVATSRPGRALLSRHPGLQHALPHPINTHVRHVTSDVVLEHQEPSVAADDSDHALDVTSGVLGHLSSDVFQNRYRLGKQAGRGHFGEVWLATQLSAAESDNSNMHASKILRGKGIKVGAQSGAASTSSNEGLKNGEALVLKRVSGDGGEAVKRSALREAYFGQLLEKRRKDLQLQVQQEQAMMRQQTTAGNASVLLAGHDHLVRFVEGFTGYPEGDVWLVFQNEGKSLHNVMYEPTQLADSDDNPSDSGAGTNRLSIVGPSKWWTDVRSSAASNLFVASIMEQLLQALAAVHAANISHRDVKPENLLVRPLNAEQQGSEQHSAVLDPLALHLRLIDFGSAVDERSISAGLYGRRRQGPGGQEAEGPSLDELTLEYAPPEVLFGSRYHHPLASGMSKLHAYDIWSAGVVMLELVLGTPSVFTPSPRTRAAVDRQLHLQGRPAEERQLLYLLRGLMELCFYPPRVKSQTHPKASSTPNTRSQDANPTSAHPPEAGALPLPWDCCDEALLKLIKSRDPQQVGLEGALAVRLLQRLLSWDPAQRPTALQALRHAYFVAAEHMRRSGTTASSSHYQELLAECGKREIGDAGWC